MSWITELVKTYDAHEDLVGKRDIEGSKAVLMPICHAVQQAKIELTIDGKGNLVMPGRFPRQNSQPSFRVRRLRRLGRRTWHHIRCMIN